MIGVAGTILGVSLGWCCCQLLVASFRLPFVDPKVYFISRLPVSMHPMEFILPAVIAIGICLVATLFPAVFAGAAPRGRPDGLRMRSRV